MKRSTPLYRPVPPARTAAPIVAAVLVLSAALALPSPAGATNLVDGVALWAGSFNVLNSERSGEVGFELRMRPLGLGPAEVPWVLRPAAGFMTTTENALYGYLGFRLEVPVAERWTLTPQTAAGVYDRGNDRDLGGSIQFRSGLELAYQVNPGNRVGAVFYHLSNAGLEDRNPGSESLVIFWSWR
jgi:lipid A 3-O-deacylase